VAAADALRFCALVVATISAFIQLSCCRICFVVDWHFSFLPRNIRRHDFSGLVFARDWQVSCAIVLLKLPPLFFLLFATSAASDVFCFLNQAHWLTRRRPRVHLCECELNCDALARL
jgi:hypothetical protein